MRTAVFYKYILFTPTSHPPSVPTPPSSPPPPRDRRARRAAGRAGENRKRMEEALGVELSFSQRGKRQPDLAALNHQFIRSFSQRGKRQPDLAALISNLLDPSRSGVPAPRAPRPAPRASRSGRGLARSVTLWTRFPPAFARRVSSECTVGTRVGATVGRGGPAFALVESRHDGRDESSRGRAV